MDFNHVKKLLVASLFASGILSGSAMASYVSDGSAGIFHPLVDNPLDLSVPAAFPQFSNIYIDAGIRTILRIPSPIFGAQLIVKKHVPSARKLNLRGGIRADGGENQIAGRRDLPVLISDKSRLINWKTLDLDGSGKVNLAKGGDISLHAPIADSNIIISNRGDLSLSQPGAGAISGGSTFNGARLSLQDHEQLTSGIISMMGNGGNLYVGSLTPSSPVPLPAAGILLGSGLLGLLSFGAGRRRR